MPTVPRRTNLDVKTDSLPHIRTANAAPTLDTSKVTAATQDIVNTGLAIDHQNQVRKATAQKEYDDFQLAEKKKADQVVVQDFDLEASKAHSDIENLIKKDPQFQGPGSLKAQEFAQEEWKKRTEDLKKNLYNDEQLAAADHISKVYEANLYEAAGAHASSTMEKYDTDQTKSYVETVRNEGFNNAMDESRIQQSIFQQKAALDKYGARKGLLNPDGSRSDTLKAQVAEAVSDTHVGVIEKRVSLGNIGAARAYYKAHEKEIVGKDSLKFPEYLDAQEKRLKALRDDGKKKQYEETLRADMLASFSGKLTLTELQRQYRNDEVDLSDYKSMAHIVADPMFSFMRPDQLTDPETFNEIREAQLSGSKTQGEVLRMITEAGKSGKLVNNPIAGGNDIDYLTNLTKESISPSPDEVRTQGQANYVRDFAERYLGDHEGFLQKHIPTEKGKKQKDQKAEEMVSEFIRQVDKEQAKGDRIDEIAKDVIGRNAKKDHPGLNALEDLPHVTIDVQGKVHRLLNPSQKTKLKGHYKIMPNKIEAPAPKKKTDK